MLNRQIFISFHIKTFSITLGNSFVETLFNKLKFWFIGIGKLDCRLEI